MSFGFDQKPAAGVQPAGAVGLPALAALAALGALGALAARLLGRQQARRRCL